jgi:hypothetical protein
MLAVEERNPSTSVGMTIGGIVILTEVEGPALSSSSHNPGCPILAQPG